MKSLDSRQCLSYGFYLNVRSESLSFSSDCKQGPWVRERERLGRRQGTEVMSNSFETRHIWVQTLPSLLINVIVLSRLPIKWENSSYLLGSLWKLSEILFLVYIACGWWYSHKRNRVCLLFQATQTSYQYLLQKSLLIPLPMTNICIPTKEGVLTLRRNG